MSNGLKLVGFFAVIGGLLWAIDQAKNYAAKFAYRITGYGKPKLTGYVIQVPIQIEFNNPAPLTITIERFIADVFMWKNGAYEFVGRLDQPVQLPSGRSNQVLAPSLDLQKLFSGNAFQTITDTLKNRSIDLRTEITATFQGVALPKQVFNNTIWL
jgi:hypothetical protein